MNSGPRLRVLGCIALAAFAASSVACSTPNAGGDGETQTGGSPGSGGRPATGGSPGNTGGTPGGTGGGSAGSPGSGGTPAGTGGGSADAGGGTGGTTGGDAGPSAGPKSKMLQLDTTATGANVMGDVPKYPVAVVLNGTNFDFASAKPKGEDLRFTTAEGAALPHHVEFWDGTAKQAAVWVKVDVKGNSKQSIKMSWGDPNATDTGDSKKVFDVADGFTGVWHLSEPGSAAPGTYKDATGNEAHADGVMIDAMSTGDGRIGKSLLLANAKKQWVQVPLEKSKLYDMPNKMTYSIWFNAKTHNVPYQCMFSKGEGGFRLHYVGLASYYGNKHITEPCVESTVSNDVCPVNTSSGTDAAPGKWFQILAVHDHPSIKFYVNGKLEAMLNSMPPWKSDATKMVMIGNNSSSLGRAFDGFLDEARLMNVAKDANWVKLEYESQREGQMFLTFAP